DRQRRQDHGSRVRWRGCPSWPAQRRCGDQARRSRDRQRRCAGGGGAVQGTGGHGDPDVFRSVGREQDGSGDAWTGAAAAMSRLREEQKMPMSRLREEQKMPMSRLREEQKVTMSRLREEQKMPMSRLRLERNAGVRSARDQSGLRMVAPLSALRDTVTFMEQPRELVGRALVVVVDDRTAHGDEEDHSGPLVTELLTEAGFVVDGVVVVAADEVEIRNALNTAVIGGVDLVVSVGGTG